MNDFSPRGALTLSIAAVERDTGLSKDTLRIWERRYGFPNPERDPSGERAYPLDQVERLRLVKRLLDAGHRPGRVVGLDAHALQQLADASGVDRPVQTAAVATHADVIDDCLAQIRQHDLDGLRRQLGRDLARLGLPAFVLERAVPLTRAIGDAWLRGQMQVYEEHACTEVLLSVLRGAIAVLPSAEPLASPRMLLATLPGEPHALALHLAEAMLTLNGAVCVQLGAQTPVRDVVMATDAYRCDIVVLALSGISGTSAALDALSELRESLPQTVSIWVGGNAPVLQRRPLEGVLTLEAIHDLVPALAAWRLKHP